MNESRLKLDSKEGRFHLPAQKTIPPKTLPVSTSNFPPGASAVYTVIIFPLNEFFPALLIRAMQFIIQG